MSGESPEIGLVCGEQASRPAHVGGLVADDFVEACGQIREVDGADSGGSGLRLVGTGQAG
jgi:hypothetical protein